MSHSDRFRASCTSIFSFLPREYNAFVPFVPPLYRDHLVHCADWKYSKYTQNVSLYFSTTFHHPVKFIMVQLPSTLPSGLLFYLIRIPDNHTAILHPKIGRHRLLPSRLQPHPLRLQTIHPNKESHTQHPLHHLNLSR